MTKVWISIWFSWETQSKKVFQLEMSHKYTLIGKFPSKIQKTRLFIYIFVFLVETQ